MKHTSPGFNPVTCATIYVNKAYDAILNGTPSPMSHDRFENKFQK